MIVFLWSAGTAEGVTDSARKARGNAAALIRSSKADTALVEQAHFIPGVDSLEAGYQRPDPAWYWTARRRPSGRIFWQRRVRALELAAS